MAKRKIYPEGFKWDAVDLVRSSKDRTLTEMVSLAVVYGINGRECAGVCPGRTSTGECRSLSRRRATA